MPTPTYAFNCGSELGMLDPIDEVSGAAGSAREQQTSSRPVLVEDWAEGLIGLGFAESPPRERDRRSDTPATGEGSPAR